MQACAFRDSYEKFKKAGAVVVGISGDDPSSHKVCKIFYTQAYTYLVLLPSMYPTFAFNETLGDRGTTFKWQFSVHLHLKTPLALK